LRELVAGTSANVDVRFTFRVARVTEPARGDFARTRRRPRGGLTFARSLVTSHQAQLLEERAFRMRCSPTRSEEWLWRRLSGSKTGCAFRRQLVIGPSIADFACTKVRLVVEVDGPAHEGRAWTHSVTACSLRSDGPRSAFRTTTSSKTSRPSSPSSPRRQRRSSADHCHHSNERAKTQAAPGRFFRPR
jgi:very-short-patch-repair endonuclease